MNKSIKPLLVFLAALICLFTAACQPPPAEQLAYGVYIGISTDEILKIHGYDVLVIDADFFSAETIAQLRQNGNTAIYSYLNIGSIETFRTSYADFEAITLGPYENWPEERWVDVSQPQWGQYLNAKAQELADKGIDGFFLDNADVYYVYEAEEIYQGLLSILQTLHRLDLPLIINGGDVFVTTATNRGDLAGLIHGVNQETVFTSINFQNQTYGRQNKDNRDYLIEYLMRCKENGLQVHLLEYGASPMLAQQIQAFCTQNGFLCFIAPSLELNELPR